MFTDISTGRLWYVDYQEMLKADDGNPDTMAPMHEIQIRWDDPNDSPDARQEDLSDDVSDCEAAYHARGGKDPDLPGRATVSGSGRADAHFAVDAAGELYIFSKTDGMIRAREPGAIARIRRASPDPRCESGGSRRCSSARQCR